MVSMCWRFITGLLGNQHPGKRREEGRWNTYVEKSDYTLVGQRGVPKMSWTRGDALTRDQADLQYSLLAAPWAEVMTSSQLRQCSKGSYPETHHPAASKNSKSKETCPFLMECKFSLERCLGSASQHPLYSTSPPESTTISSCLPQ